MKNWKEYVSLQKVTTLKDSKGFAFYLKTKFDDDKSLSLVIEKLSIELKDYIYTEETIGDAVENVIREFPEFEVKKFSLEHTKIRKWCFIKKWPFIRTWIYDNKEAWNTINSNLVANRIAQNTRRGFGNTRFEDYMYYNGNNAVDRPIIVSEYKGNYALIKHPSFEKYGFKIVEI